MAFREVPVFKVRENFEVVAVGLRVAGGCAYGPQRSQDGDEGGRCGMSRRAWASRLVMTSPG